MHKRMSILTFKGLSTTFKGSLNVSYNTSLHTSVPIGANVKVALNNEFLKIYCFTVASRPDH